MLITPCGRASHRNPGAYEDRQSLHVRLTALQIGAVVCFVLLAVSFWVLQVVQHEKYKEMADNNHLRTIPLRAPRGVLFDRNGKVLVENRYSFTIAHRSRARDQPRRDADAGSPQVTGVDEAEIREIVQRRRREPIFRPIAVIEHATEEQVVAVLARAARDAARSSSRKCRRARIPRAARGAPLRLRRRDPGVAARARGVRRPAARAPIVGQTGLERIYNAKLMGEDGNRFVVVNSVGREIEKLERAARRSKATRLQLTIDADMQRALEEAFQAHGFNGAAAFLDPRTGEMLAMTSLPAYDPERFAGGIDRAKCAALLGDPLKPMTNRLIQGTYSPGIDVQDRDGDRGARRGRHHAGPQVFCPGSAVFYGRPFKCHKKGGHGRVDLRTRIEQSCNVYFYNVGDRMQIDTIHKYAAELGLTGKTGIDLPSEVDSLVPSTEWKQRTFKQPWYPGETISVAIGQGAVSVTPIALATMIATVANGGTLVTPHLVRAVDEATARAGSRCRRPRRARRLSILPQNLQAVRDGLWMVVNGAGTGGAGAHRRPRRGRQDRHGAGRLDRRRQGRDGASMDMRDNGWFVFFAPRDNPQIAGVVFAEHGEHGSSAAPIAKHVLETFFAKQEGRPLPVLAKPAHRHGAAPAAGRARLPPTSGPGRGGAPAPDPGRRTPDRAEPREAVR